MTVKLRLTVAALLLFLVVMVDFTSRIMSVLADGVLVCGIVVLLWPVIKRTACIMLDFLFAVY
ncbi:putative membrane protein [Escherichia coli DEC4D]|nr:putative membrane protein [Escherichia coli DEC4D]